MVELIKIVEGFFACGVAASVYGLKDGSGNIQPDSVFSNVGKLLLATQIYDMQRLAHYVSGGSWWGCQVPMRITTRQPRHACRPSSPAARTSKRGVGLRWRIYLEDLTASDSAGWYSIISLHGGGSPEAMEREIWRQYPLEDKVALVEGLLERGVAGDIARPRAGQPGRCCITGCQVPEPPHAATDTSEVAEVQRSRGSELLTLAFHRRGR